MCSSVFARLGKKLVRAAVAYNQDRKAKKKKAPAASRAKAKK